MRKMFKTIQKVHSVEVFCELFPQAPLRLVIVFITQVIVNYAKFPASVKISSVVDFNGLFQLTCLASLN